MISIYHTLETQRGNKCNRTLEWWERQTSLNWMNPYLLPLGGLGFSRAPLRNMGSEVWRMRFKACRARLSVTERHGRASADGCWLNINGQGCWRLDHYLAPNNQHTHTRSQVEDRSRFSWRLLLVNCHLSSPSSSDLRHTNVHLAGFWDVILWSGSVIDLSISCLEQEWQVAPGGLGWTCRLPYVFFSFNIARFCCCCCFFQLFYQTIHWLILMEPDRELGHEPRSNDGFVCFSCLRNAGPVVSGWLYWCPYN